MLRRGMMLHTVFILMPIFPITSSVPWVQQCTKKIVHWNYGIDVVVEKCSLQEIKPRIQAQNEK